MSSLIRLTEQDEQALRAIEANIDHHLQAVVGLRRRLNSFVHINRLPSELLAEIFLLCQDLDGGWELSKFPSGGSDRQHIALSHRWVLITTVCYHWRKLAIQTPRFWSRINLAYPRFAHYSLRLAKKSPLCLETIGLGDTHRSLLDEIVSHDFRRVSSIRWYFLHQDIVCSGSPLRAESSIVFSQLRSISVISASTRQDILPLFANVDFPTIQTLDLVNCVGNIPPCLLAPTLKTLSLIVMYGSQRVAFVHFFRCLSQMKQLTSIELLGIDFGQNQETTWPQISLPHLRQAIIYPPSNGHENYIPLLHSLAIPLTTHLNLDFSRLQISIAHESLLLLLSFFHGHVRSSDFRTIVLRDAGVLVIELWEDALDPAIFATNPPRPSYSLTLPSNSLQQNPLWDMLTHLFELDNVETLRCVGSTHSFTVDQEWRRLLRPCHALKILILEGCDSTAFIESLDRDTEPDWNLDGGDINDESDPSLRLPVAPNLKALHLDHISWELESMQGGQSFHGLLSTMAYRINAGHPIQDVHITRCLNVNEDRIADLREKLGEVMDGAEVHWDGHEEYEQRATGGSGISLVYLDPSDRQPSDGDWYY